MTAVVVDAELVVDLQIVAAVAGWLRVVVWPFVGEVHATVEWVAEEELLLHKCYAQGLWLEADLVVVGVLGAQVVVEFVE